MDFRHLIVTCLFSMLRLPFDNQKVKENYAIFNKEHNNYSFSDASKMEIIYDESNKKWYLQKKGVKIQAGNTWQIRSQILNMEVTPQNAEGHFETDVTDESQFTVSQTGNYEIRWYFNEPTPYVIVIKE